MVVNRTNVYKPSCHPLLLNKPNTLKQFTGCLQTGVHELMWSALSTNWEMQMQQKLHDDLRKDITIDITTDPQMFPNVPAMHITKCTPNILEKRSWFSSSIRPRMETTLDSSNPRNVILLCTAGLIKSIVKTRFGSLEGKSFVQIY